MNGTEIMLGVVFEPTQLQRYKELEKRKTIRSVARRIAAIDRDLVELRALGDEDALRGAYTSMERALMTLVAIPARTIAELEHKQRTLTAHAAFARPNASFDQQIAVALLMDYNLLELTPEQIRDMKRMLDPLYAIDVAVEFGVH